MSYWDSLAQEHLLIKICGVRKPLDVEAALHGGAQLIGLVFVPGSRRRLDLACARELRQAIGTRARAVGVFMDQPPPEVHEIARALRLDALQLHGAEPLAAWCEVGWPLIKRVTPRARAVPLRRDDVLWLLDPGAGQGLAHDWQGADIDAREAMVAGGLSPANVAGILQATAARGVDVSSGVEGSGGQKDPDAIVAFCTAARMAFERRGRPAGAAALIAARVHA
jgi:phosphoribosylanthranilate isomerase